MFLQTCRSTSRRAARFCNLAKAYSRRAARFCNLAKAYSRRAARFCNPAKAYSKRAARFCNPAKAYSRRAARFCKLAEAYSRRAARFCNPAKASPLPPPTALIQQKTSIGHWKTRTHRALLPMTDSIRASPTALHHRGFVQLFLCISLGYRIFFHLL